MRIFVRIFYYVHCCLFKTGIYFFFSSQYNKHMNKAGGYSTLLAILSVLTLSASLIAVVLMIDTYSTVEPPAQDVSSSIPENDLVFTSLDGGYVRIKDPAAGFNIVIPGNYKISGTGGNFTVYVDSGEESPELKDFAKLHFRQVLASIPFEDKVRESYEENAEISDGVYDYSKITERNVGTVEGLSYSCPFLVDQECIFIPVVSTPGSHLFILKTLEDSGGVGYDGQLEAILQTFSF
jgi:hypothetical protein